MMKCVKQEEDYGVALNCLFCRHCGVASIVLDARYDVFTLLSPVIHIMYQLQGIDIKVEQALNIVNECVRKYGEAKVLMDIGQSEVAAKKGSRRPARTRNATHAARKGA